MKKKLLLIGLWLMVSHTLLSQQLVKEINRFSGSSSTSELFSYNGMLYFSAQTEKGREFWAFNDNESTPYLLEESSSHDIEIIGNVNPKSFVALNNEIGLPI